VKKLHSTATRLGRPDSPERVFYSAKRLHPSGFIQAASPKSGFAAIVPSYVTGFAGKPDQLT
jgi:hypothetical protein